MQLGSILQMYEKSSEYIRTLSALLTSSEYLHFIFQTFSQLTMDLGFSRSIKFLNDKCCNILKNLMNYYCHCSHLMSCKNNFNSHEPECLYLRTKYRHACRITDNVDVYITPSPISGNTLFLIVKYRSVMMICALLSSLHI